MFIRRAASEMVMPFKRHSLVLKMMSGSRLELKSNSRRLVDRAVAGFLMCFFGFGLGLDFASGVWHIEHAHSLVRHKILCLPTKHRLQVRAIQHLS